MFIILGTTKNNNVLLSINKLLDYIIEISEVYHHGGIPLYYPKLDNDNWKYNISIKNGNFFIGYTDIVYPGGFEPKIDRTYNSKTPFKGIFGNGWGNEYEAFVTVSADGSTCHTEGRPH